MCCWRAAWFWVWKFLWVDDYQNSLDGRREFLLLYGRLTSNSSDFGLMNKPREIDIWFYWRVVRLMF